MSYLQARPPPQVGLDLIDTMADAGCAAGLLHALEHGAPAVQVPALRALATMLTGSDAATRAVLEGGLPRLLPAFFSSSCARTRREACWAVSSVATGSVGQVAALMETSLVGLVVQRLTVDEFDVKRMALCAVANVLHAFSVEPCAASAGWVASLVYEMGAVAPLVAMLDIADAETARVALDASASLLAAGAYHARCGAERSLAVPNPFALAFDEAGAVERLEALLQHPNNAICERAAALIDAHFGDEGWPPGMDGLTPAVAAEGFVFGASPGPMLSAGPALFAF